jgi:Mrp family chromosome partitioning ATPase
MRAEADYDLVVIDTPPPAMLVDAVTLLKHVTGVLVVCRAGHTARGAARELRSDLDKLGATVLGVVISGQRDARRAYASKLRAPLTGLWSRRRHRRYVLEDMRSPRSEEEIPRMS